MLKQFSNNYPLVMRFFLAFVLGWFGISEILTPKYFSGYVPQIATALLPISLYNLVQIHGAVLLILALCLIFRLYLRYTGVVILLVLLSIIGGLISISGFNEIAVRDIGLFGLALSIWLYEIHKANR